MIYRCTIDVALFLGYCPAFHVEERLRMREAVIDGGPYQLISQIKLLFWGLIEQCNN